MRVAQEQQDAGEVVTGSAGQRGGHGVWRVEGRSRGLQGGERSWSRGEVTGPVRQRGVRGLQGGGGSGVCRAEWRSWGL